jgi:quercetin dioxygenase-like cupin family protein
LANIILKKDQKILKSTVPGRYRIFLIGKETGAKFLKADLFTYLPGAQGQEHFHTCESFTYIIEGKCLMTINGIAKKIGKQDAILLPARETHSVKNTGRKKMIMLEVYGPLAKAGTVWINKDLPRGWVSSS